MKLEGINPRLYQERIFNASVKNNTLVVIPTGLGKTMIGMMLAVYRLNKFKNTKILFMAPTKPLCAQHMKFSSLTKVTCFEIFVLEMNFRPKKHKLWFKPFKKV